MNKYGNRTVKDVNGEKFDSMKEMRRWNELKLLERAGRISNLQRQVKYELIPSQYVDGKHVEYPCSYVADFVYVENGKTVVEDTKGYKTKDYIIKRKLLLFRHGIRIKEV